MKKHALLTMILVVAVSHLMLFSCKKTETAGAPPPDAHRSEMLKRSFEASKKVIAAKVNGEAITLFALLREMNAIAPQYLSQGRQRTPALDNKIRNAALNNVIIQELAVQEARKRGMKVNPDVMDGEIKKMKANAGSPAAFQEYLDNNGLTEDELRQTVEQDALFELIATQEVDEKITVTDAALRERYNREKAGLKDSAHRQMTFEQAKALLEQRVRAEAAEKRMRQWETELKKNARIEIVKQDHRQG
jgi:hypothetical protein